MKFEIVEANIVDLAADAIILPANEKLREGSGASTAIFQAAGRRELMAACRKIGHCETGSAVPTSAFHLKDLNYIIHAVVPKWKDGKHNEYEMLSSAYMSALYIADEMKCREIAFPLLAAGNNGFDTELAFEVAHDSVNSFQGKNLNTAILVLYGSRLASKLEQQGYTVIKMADKTAANNRIPFNIKMPVFSGQFTKMGQKIVESGIAYGTEWIKDPENQRLMLEFGTKIVKQIFQQRTSNYSRR